jgi:hypothetical protein
VERQLHGVESRIGVRLLSLWSAASFPSTERSSF